LTSILTTQSVTLIDRLKGLHPTQHKIGHFSDTLSSQSVGYSSTEKNKSNITKHLLIKNRDTTTQNKHKKLKPYSVASYDLQPGNGEGPINILPGTTQGQPVTSYHCNSALQYTTRRDINTFLPPTNTFIISILIANLQVKLVYLAPSHFYCSTC